MHTGLSWRYPIVIQTPISKFDPNTIANIVWPCFLPSSISYTTDRVYHVFEFKHKGDEGFVGLCFWQCAFQNISCCMRWNVKCFLIFHWLARGGRPRKPLYWKIEGTWQPVFHCSNRIFQFQKTRSLQDRIAVHHLGGQRDPYSQIY